MQPYLVAYYTASFSVIYIYIYRVSVRSLGLRLVSGLFVMMHTYFNNTFCCRCHSPEDWKKIQLIANMCECLSDDDSHFGPRTSYFTRDIMFHLFVTESLCLQLLLNRISPNSTWLDVMSQRIKSSRRQTVLRLRPQHFSYIHWIHLPPETKFSSLVHGVQRDFLS